MNYTPFLAFAALLVATSQAPAEQSLVRGVVELFTSQGCDSCPKADKMLGEMVHQKDIVALAYHVDYWDYRGWRDTLATPENTDRQRNYMKAMKARAFYTPQAVINGRTHVNGADQLAVDEKLAETPTLPVAVNLKQDRDVLVIDVPGQEGPRQNAHVLLVSYEAMSPVKIERGENAGHTVTYWNAVRDMQTTGMWHGQPARFEIPMSEIAKKGIGGCAVLVQSVDKDGHPATILGAASMPFDAQDGPNKN
ncbi:DUF1223 domain-containing protein [Tianweitania aestuarii]|uniref:DUF1223 domain-containing protein n=1 Tax=Tianweitania aestuarii TaxID=2814886 RepID=UPI0032650C72